MRRTEAGRPTIIEKIKAYPNLSEWFACYSNFVISKNTSEWKARFE
jgi:hypothetical protein